MAKPSIKFILVNRDWVPDGLRPSKTTWAMSPPVGCCYPHPPSPFTIINQSQSWYSFYRPMGLRLSCPSHCSKGVQPGSKTAGLYHSGCGDKYGEFDPESSHTAAMQVISNRLLRHAEGWIGLCAVKVTTIIIVNEPWFISDDFSFQLLICNCFPVWMFGTVYDTESTSSNFLYRCQLTVLYRPYIHASQLQWHITTPTELSITV